MVKIRASQVFTHSIDDAVAARKALDADEPFKEVVEKYSTCPSKQQGGDLGWVSENAISKKCFWPRAESAILLAKRQGSDQIA
mgnify:CR=1 FL=1